MLAAAGLAVIAGVPAAGEDTVPPAAAALHERLLTLDGHLDTPASLDLPGWSIGEAHSVEEDYTQVDLPRMKAGGLDGGLWAIYTPQGPLDPAGYRAARDFAVMRGVSIHRMIAADPGNFALALTADDAARIAAEGKRVVYISMENAYPIGEDLTLVSLFERMGVRVIGFAHFAHNQFADSSTDPSGAPRWDGLSPLGEALLAELNRRGIVADLSHSSDAALDDALRLSRAPVLLTHSGCKAVYDHPRNIDDDRLRALAAKGGVIMMNAFGAYLRPIAGDPARDQALRALFASIPRRAMTAAEREALLARRREIDRQFPPADEAQFADFMAHLLHALKVVGPDHVGIGLDWDGGGGTQDMRDVVAVPRITAALIAAGYDEAAIANIWSGNLVRVLREAQAAAEKAPGQVVG